MYDNNVSLFSLQSYMHGNLSTLKNLPKSSRMRSQSTYVFMYDAPKDEIASVLTFARAARSFEI